MSAGDDSVKCPSCANGRMFVCRGTETKLMLRCDTCPEYFYGSRGLTASLSFRQPDHEEAFALLERYDVNAGEFTPELQLLTERLR